MYRIIGADGREYGPISADQVRQWIAQNRANASTPALAEGVTEWKPLSAYPEFFTAFTPAAAPAPFPTATYSSQSTHPFATTGLILGAISISFGLCCCYGLPFSATGLVFSIIALAQIRSHPERYTGSAMAIVGIVLCCISLMLMFLLMLLGLAGSLFDHPMHHGYRL